MKEKDKLAIPDPERGTKMTVDVDTSTNDDSKTTAMKRDSKREGQELVRKNRRSRRKRRRQVTNREDDKLEQHERAYQALLDEDCMGRFSSSPSPPPALETDLPKTSNDNLETEEIQTKKPKYGKHLGVSNAFESMFGSLPLLLRQRECGGGPMRCRKFRRGSHRSRVTAWQQEVLARNSFVRDPSVEERASWTFRSFARRMIPFTKLQTPVNEAVLGLERMGSFLLCLGGCDEDGVNYLGPSGGDCDNPTIHPSLYLRFYVIPGRSALRRRDSEHGTEAEGAGGVKRIMTVPLDLVSSDEAVARRMQQQEQQLADGGWWFPPPAMPKFARVRLHLSVAADWEMGVALWQEHQQPDHYLPTRGQRPDSPFHVVLMPMPRAVKCGATKVRTLRLATGNIKAVRCYQDVALQRTLLWNATLLPTNAVSKDIRSTFHGFTRESGYLIVLQITLGSDGVGYGTAANDMLRFTWVRFACQVDAEEPVHVTDWRFPSSVGPKDNIVQRIDLSTGLPSWVPCEGDSLRRASNGVFESTAEINLDGRVDELQVAAEAVLNPRSLLGDILDRRPALCGPSVSADSCLLCYRTVSVLHGGRVVEILLSFGPPEATRKSCKTVAVVAVFVQVDIFTQRYREMKWVKRQFTGSDCTLLGVSSLSFWCGRLSLERRMQTRRVGPFRCLSSSKKVAQGLNLAGMCDAGMSEPELWSDWDPRAWEWAVVDKSSQDDDEDESKERAFKRTTHGKKKIAFESLYPDSYVFDNSAINRNLISLQKLASPGAPVQIGYH